MEILLFRGFLGFRVSALCVGGWWGVGAVDMLRFWWGVGGVDRGKVPRWGLLILVDTVPPSMAKMSGNEQHGFAG